MKHFNFTATVKVLLIAVVLIAPKLVSAQIGPIGTINNNTANVTVFPALQPGDQHTGTSIPNPGRSGVLLHDAGRVGSARSVMLNPLSVRTSGIAPGSTKWLFVMTT
ncbi:MAG: hypothetical protein IPG10_06635 [Flavobacteriales bacterium]|nr:hypothetical protein [Flavobacteriales bacterium]